MDMKCLVLSGHPRKGSWYDCHKYYCSQEALVLFTLQFDPAHTDLKMQLGKRAAGPLMRSQKGTHLEGPCPTQGTFWPHIRQTLHSGSEISNHLRC